MAFTNTSQVVDGRQSLAFILDPASSVMDSGSLAVGECGFIVAKASASSAFGDLPVNTFFWAVKETTLASGDKFIKCDPLFAGQAQGKSVSQSKNTVDVTIDYDGSTNNTTDGIVTTSGSLSGCNIIESAKQKSAVNLIKSRFGSITEIDKTGAVTAIEADTTNKDILLIIWNGRSAKEGDLLNIAIIPALFSSLAIDGSYGSSQTFNVDFSGNYSDENGYIGGNFQIENVKGLIPYILRPAGV